ncbi:lysozyme family protein [Acutalibacter muris]|uniref:Lysozyme family protein n=1 Tax=Acutalibacter muris TaxID=1796620 RepID=A0A1Z2XSM8_9FIRM|nr:lysozyme family protein [Acutalibacter muris]ANU55384.1 hypothetical protein A4V00_15940 [Hungateiclostridiaceae bacterium KB18]ASB41381.1 hypothetical protein ADH66_12385 [Acutalibacter muris]QQR30643.1 lysozyme family protein [Acutalibacter muris]
MSSDILTRDRQNQEADSSEQYAINAMGDRALQSAGYIVKRSRRALEKAMDKSHTPPQPGVSEAGISKRAYQPVTAPQNIEPKKVHTPEYSPPPQSGEYEESRSKRREDNSREPLPPSEAERDSAPVPSREQDSSTVIRKAGRKKGAVPSTTAKKDAPSAPKGSTHMRAEDSSLRLNEEHPLNTWQNSSSANSLQNQGAALRTAEASGAAVQTLQAAGQSAGNAGAAAAANAAAPGVGAAIQVTEKAAAKIREAIENIAASAPKSKSSWGALAALFLLPFLVIGVIAGGFRGSGSVKNVNLSAEVIALMPQIRAACQANGIPEYAPLVAAVVMQESGGRADDVGGDVMQCAEGMGLPVGTPVSVEESINFGTGIIARNLHEAGAAGPTDIPRISLALQGYNFGNGYISWALARGGYSKENAREFSEMQAAAHGWSGYGDINYVDNVLRYYKVSVGGMGDASAIADGRFAYPLPGHTWDTYPGHNGIDISFANCYGEPVYAVAAGTVRYVQDGWTPAYGVDNMWSFGNSVFIEHGDGWISAYGHLSALAVTSGETVTQGQLIGYIGSTGNSTGPHLHLALYHDGEAGVGGQNYAELAWPQYRE